MQPHKKGIKSSVTDFISNYILLLYFSFLFFKHHLYPTKGGVNNNEFKKPCLRYSSG